VRIPEAEGGLGADALADVEVTEVLAGACAATWFVVNQHRTPQMLARGGLAGLDPAHFTAGEAGPGRRCRSPSWAGPGPSRWRSTGSPSGTTPSSVSPTARPTASSTPPAPPTPPPQPPACSAGSCALAELDRPGAAELAATLSERAEVLRAEALALLTEVPLRERVPERLALRGELGALTVRAANALVAARSGAAMLLESPEQRWAREASFHLVQAQTPPVREAQLAALGRLPAPQR
jgi:hypothetical protein